MKHTLLTALFFIALYSSLSNAATKGESAPNCFAPEIINNKVANIADYRNKVIYLDFWASWCPTCKKSFPFLNRLHNDLKDQGFEIIAINLDENKEDALEFLQKNPVNFSILYDNKGKCPGVYNVMAMPASYLIDKRGIVREVHLGFKDDDFDKIRSSVLSLLDE